MRFNSISISGYHIHEAGAPARWNWPSPLADGLEYLEDRAWTGLDVDDFARPPELLLGDRHELLLEIAKMRARACCGKLMRTASTRKKKSLDVAHHCQTSGWA